MNRERTIQLDNARTKLESYMETWRNNPVLREQYRGYYDKIIEYLPSSRQNLVEIGSGGRGLKNYLKHTVSADIVKVGTTNLIMDAHKLPFKSGSLDALILVDVAHHLYDPMGFFREVDRCLKIGGRILMVDVYISPISYIIYKLFHEEKVDLNEDFWNKNPLSEQEMDPWASNQAFATKVFWKEEEKFRLEYPCLTITCKESFDWCLPLSGGFSYPSILPESLSGHIKSMSNWKLFNIISAFRSFVVVEKKIQT